jgi:signal transduction histidine kinase
MVTFFLVHMKLKPISELQHAAQLVSQGNFKATIDYAGHDELSQMAQAFNNMSNSLLSRTNLLKDKVREQRDFISYVAHELKSPVGAVRWALELLIDNNGKSTKSERREMLVHALNVNENMRNLIGELLDCSRMERGAMVLSREESDIESIIRGMLKEHSLEFEKDHFLVNIWFPSRVLPKIFADRKRISQAVDNIIVNAHKYGLSGGKIDVRLCLTNVSGPAKRSGRFIRVSIRDYGIGIPTKQKNEVFKRFFRAENAVESGIEGTGLGLHITKRLIEMHGGEIWLSSTLGKGTIFRFTVPIYEQKA